MSIFILVVNEGKLSVPGDNQQCSNYGCNTRHGKFNRYDKYRCSKLGHAVVVNIWNIDVWPRQKHLTPAVSCYFMSLSEKYLICLIVLCCYRRPLPQWYPLSYLTEITIEDILKGEFNWNMYEITPPCYVINICILYRLYFKQNDFLKEEPIEYTHANFYHATTFGRRNIAFQIWWLPCYPHRSEWPKTSLGGVWYHHKCWQSLRNKIMLSKLFESKRRWYVDIKLLSTTWWQYLNIH